MEFFETEHVDDSIDHKFWPIIDRIYTLVSKQERDSSRRRGIRNWERDSGSVTTPECRE